MEESFERYHPDMEAFHRRMRAKPCFVCEIVAGTNELPQHFVYEDDTALPTWMPIPARTATRWWLPKSTASR